MADRQIKEVIAAIMSVSHFKGIEELDYNPHNSGGTILRTKSNISLDSHQSSEVLTLLSSAADQENEEEIKF